ncbi:MAG: PAS-domain containing protein [Rhodospirillales bacterium]|nr:PAS-domain containing protein [Rhodospirillales bacterium]
MVIGNSAYLEQLGQSDLALVPGVGFEDHIRDRARQRQRAGQNEDMETWVAERMREYDDDLPPSDQFLANGRWIRINRERLEDGSVISIRFDITELKETQKELQDSERNARAYLNATSDAVALIDRNGVYVDVNEALCARKKCNPGIFDRQKKSR